MNTQSKGSLAVRVPFLVLGVTCVGLGYVGVIVPGMPSTVFFICAVWAFKRSSPRFENWLLDHRLFGPTLRDWDEHRAIAPRVKWIAIGTMVTFAIVSILLIKSLAVQIILGVTIALVAVYVGTRKTKI